MARTALFTSLGAHPSLLVGAVNDPLEHEAELNAERVASGGLARVAGAEAPPPPRAPPPAPARRDAADNQPSLDELDQVPAMPESQQEVEVAPEADVAPEGLDAADMAEIKGGGEEGGGDAGGGDAGGGDAGGGDAAAAADEPVQTDRAGLAPVAVGPEGGAAPADVAARVASPDGGQPLPAEMRAGMEHGFGTDFGHVRVHQADADRHDAARLGARAFTHGRHIWLGPGESVTDRRLMAHELTHVVQQTGSKTSDAAGREPAARSAEPTIRRGWIRDKADRFARHIPGYTLLCVLIGKSPITGDTVERTAENLIGGLMGLVPGGTLLFDQLKEAHVIQDALDWITGKLSQLDLSWARIKRVVAQAVDDFSGWHPIDSLKPAFAPLFHDISEFATSLKDKIIELIIRGALKLAGSYGAQIWEIIEGARDTIKLILDDPLGFAKNLLASVVKGFGQFSDNVLDHLKRGLLGWLFGAIEGVDLKMPERLDLKGILSIGFQLVGLSWDQVRPKIVKKLDPHGEMKASFLEKAVDVLRILVKDGILGIWQRMLAYIDSFKVTVVEGIKGYVMTSIVTAGIGWLAGLSNPVGALIKLAMAIYDVIVVFLERLNQIKEVAKSLFGSIREIALGNIQAAADKVEQTIGRTVPVVIAFIAGLLKLNGISGKIREIIKQLRTPVDKAIEKILTFLVNKAKKLFSKLIAKFNRKRKLPSIPFQFGDGDHRIFAEQKGNKINVMIGSDAETAAEKAALEAVEAKKAASPPAKAAGAAAAKAIKKIAGQTTAAAAKVDLKSQKENQRKAMKTLKAELTKAAEALKEQGRSIKKFREFDTKSGGELFRAQEPRFPDKEGLAGTYSLRSKDTSQLITSGNEPDGSGKPYSVYYENDHIPEKQYAIAISKHLDKFKPGDGGGKLDRGTDHVAAPPAQKEAGKPTVGQIGKTITNPGKDAPEFPAMTIYRPVHLAKSVSQDAESKVLEAAKATGKPGPVGAVKNVVKARILAESNEIAGIVRQDRTADATIKASVDTGLKQVADMGREIYGLNETVKADAANQEADPNKPVSALSEVPFTGDGKGKPNFTELEGVYQPHGAFKGSFGAYMEYDHVIDAAWPRHAGGLKFGQPELMARIKAAIGPKVDLKDPAIAGRLASLEHEAVFAPQQPISSYSNPSGKAIALYRPIHLAATAATRSGLPGKPADVAGKLGDGFVKPAVDYIVSGKAAELDTAKGNIRGKVKSLFKDATDLHTSVIATQYTSELQKAEAVNPGHPADAKHAMAVIVNRVKQSLSAARSATGDLFNG